MRPRVLANAMAALAATGAAMTYVFSPERYGFYPGCPIYRFTHMECPGCGGTRAVAAFLHGHFAQAMAFNPLITVALPFAIVFVVFEYAYAIRENRFRSFTLPPIARYSALALVVLFGVLRNIF